MKRYFFVLFTAIVLINCRPPLETTTGSINAPGTIVIDGKLFAAAFVQRAAEYHALCWQAFNIARLRLEEAIRQPSAKPKAIITDIDETILDNSADEVHRSLRGIEFNLPDWYKWTAMAAADTVPGALSFLKYAASKGVKIFYISNRDENDRAGTVKNLQKFGFPDADPEQLLLKQTSSAKEQRRQTVMKNYDVVLLLGDNLSDFSDFYDKQSVDNRLNIVKKQADLFGNKFIVLPNAMYGDWELALYQYKQLSSAQKDSALKSWLKGY